jgi:eukaryotic-like serine/threonine-protein kinase
MNKPDKHLLEFGPFQLDPDQRLLLRDEQPIQISPKAFDLLLALTQHGGEVVLKDDLMKMLWPDTFVEESNLGQHVFQLRKALGEKPQDHTYIITVPGRGYRFAQEIREVSAPKEAETVETVEADSAEGRGEEQIVAASRSLTRVVIEPDRKKYLRLGAAVCIGLIAIVVAAGLYWRSHRKPKLTEKDTIVLADFDNKTGDPVFDGALRQGLAAQLAQSPFLNLLSDQSAAHTLALMGQPKDAPLKPALAREVCQRTQSAAVLDGSIVQIGTRYLLTLKAIACPTDETLASTETQASDKDHVLDAMGKVASEMRGKLGESLGSVEKYDVPPEDVSTPSLEALKVYSLANKAELSNRAVESVQLYKKAIELDPQFAMAYTGLGSDYFNLDETSQAAENIQKAYDLRQRVSEREKLAIEQMYYAAVTRDFVEDRKTALLEIEIYPRGWGMINNLGVIYGYLGDYDKALAAVQKAMELAPGNLQLRMNLLISYMHSYRLDDAEAVARQTKEDHPSVHTNLYQLAFLRHDAAAMEREAAQVVGKTGFEDLIFYYQSDTSAYNGQFAKAREFTRRAADSAMRSGEKETASEYEAEAAVREALVGNLALAKSQARNALALSDGRDAAAMSAIALAIARDSLGTRLCDDLSKRFPQDTALTYNLLPTVRAAAALQDGDSSKALTALAASSQYESGQTAQEATFVLYPVYLRGQAYLAARQGLAAAAEFQKIVDHPGLVQNEPLGALAHLGIGRAYALSGDTSKAQTAYHDFFTLWKGADPDIPILKQAKAEDAKLQ